MVEVYDDHESLRESEFDIGLNACESASVDMTSSDVTVEAGWLERYSLTIIVTIFSERHDERRVLKISA